jgi:transcriptional repressor NrdR
MKCPFCGFTDTQVKDSRPSDDGGTIRRRRYCPECDSRFTTFERVQLREFNVIKSNGERRPFEAEKIIRSMRIALRKRPVTSDIIEQAAQRIIRHLENNTEGDITTAQIGELVMDALRTIDNVGYIRYASVYRNFHESDDFEQFLKTM